MCTIATIAVGCGRLNFVHHDEPDAREMDGDAQTRDAPPDALGTCDPAAPFGTPVLIAELSDPIVADGTLRLMTDELTGYFWSFRLNGTDAEIYLAKRPDLATPFTITHVSALGSTSNELDPTVSTDGTVMVLRRSKPGDDLYVASRTGDLTFGTPTAITSLDTTGVEAQGFLQPTGNELYFESARTGGGDIYRSVRTGTTFAAPSQVSELSTGSEEGDPVVTADGLTIYFRSNRPATPLGFNIYVATRASVADPFGAATLVPNVSSDGDDGPSSISADGCRLYLSSDRAGTNDIYVATRTAP